MEKLDISILYVEDEEYIRYNMITNLQRRVERVFSAVNGQDGLDKFENLKPDLVITDIKMPIMSGLEMIKHLRKIKENTKIIVLSAHSDTKSLLEAIELGVNGYVLKPFQTDKLYKLVENLANEIILNKTVEKQSKKINELYNSLVKDLETAGSVQEYLLPNHLIIEKDIYFSSTYVPSSKIGGDLYDIIKLSDGLYITYIGDISGHGVKAALLMTAVKSTINRIIEDEGLQEPYEILNRLNTILSRELFSSEYMTLMICKIDCRSHRIRFLNAGHPPLLIWNKVAEEIETIAPEGTIPVGWMPSYVYTPDEEFETDFDPEQLFFLYTDGLFECENEKGQELGLSGLKNFIVNNLDIHSPITIPQMIRNSLEDNHYNISSDDFTFLIFSFIPRVSQQKNFRIFMGRLDDDVSFLVNKICDFIEENNADNALFKSVNSNLSSWLEDNIIVKEIVDQETHYLAELELLNTHEVVLRLWSQMIDLDNNSGALNCKSSVKFENLEITHSFSDLEDFVELKVFFTTSAR